MSDAEADAYCWPHSTAMNTKEINRFLARVGLFQRRGMDEIEAERLADKCVARDRCTASFDMRACIECAHFQPAGRCARIAAGAMPKTIFQRCHEFAWQVPRSN